MAALVASVPVPLLLDSFLASSWTWLALSLATIATLLRALSRSCSLSRHRPQALLPPPQSILSPETERISSFSSQASHPLQDTQERRNQSIPALENLLQKPDALACPELGFFCRMRGCHAAPFLLCDAGWAPKIFDGQPSSACGVTGESSEGALILCPHTIDYKLGSRLRLGFLADTQKGGCETPTHGLIKEDVNPDHLWTSSDVYSKCNPLQNSLFDTPCPSWGAPLCFEMQFGWHKLLDTWLGAPWHIRSIGLAQALIPSTHYERVVKVWSTHQRNLFKALKVDESSVATLDVNIRGGLVCSACRNGEISLWDISNQACRSRICSSLKFISTLCSNVEKGVVIVGNGEFLGLWDHRSPSLAPILDGVNVSPYSTLRCEGDMLRIDQANGVFSSCDLRKAQGNCLSIGTNPGSLLMASKMEEDESFVLWDKLSCDEDDFWDECQIGYCDALQKRSSFTSRCATLVRSLSSSGR